MIAAANNKQIFKTVKYIFHRYYLPLLLLFEERNCVSKRVRRELVLKKGKGDELSLNVAEHVISYHLKIPVKSLFKKKLRRASGSEINYVYT